MATATRITVIGPTQTVSSTLVIRLQSKGYQVSALSNLAATMGVIYSDPPDILIVDLSQPLPEMNTVIRKIKEDCYFSSIPVLGLIGEHDDSIDWEATALDDFIVVPINYPELFCPFMSLSAPRFDKTPDPPPGNPSVHHIVRSGTDSDAFVMSTSKFKPYNTVLFPRECSMIANAGESGGGFTGHIGGDDFVFIVPIERAEAVCTTIIGHFTALVADIFDEREKDLGYYIATNRKGQEEKFPLMGIAIAVVPTNSAPMNHFGKVAQVAAELKKKAKRSGESCYVVDQRK